MDDVKSLPAEPEEFFIELDSNEIDAGSDGNGNMMEDSVNGLMTFELPPDWLQPMDEEEDANGGPKFSRGLRGGRGRRGRGRGRPPKTRPEITRVVKNKPRSLREFPGSVSESTPPKKISPKKPHTTTIQSPKHTQQADGYTPESPLGGSILDITVPQQLSKDSPLCADASKRFVHSPSVKVGNASHQTEVVESLIETSELPLQLWLNPLLKPIGPSGTLDRGKGFPNTGASHNVTLLPTDIYPRISECEHCGCPFSVQKPGDRLCFNCRVKEQKNPKIVVNKVFLNVVTNGGTNTVLSQSQVQQEVVTKEHARKPMMSPKSKLKKEKMETPPDGADEDEEDGLKKRSRRMCGQCPPCLVEADCGKCDFCMDKPKFGGVNKKRQKCRLRQCKLQSKLHFRRLNSKFRYRTLETYERLVTSKRKLKKQKRGRKDRKIRRKPWEKDDDDDDDEELLSDEDGEELCYTMNGSKRKKLDYSYKEEDGVVYVEADIDDNEDELSMTEEDSVSLDNEPSNEAYHSTTGVRTQGLYSPQVMFAAPPAPSNPPQITDSINSLVLEDEMCQNGILHIEMVRVGSPQAQCTEEGMSIMQQDFGGQLETAQMITQIISLASPEAEPELDTPLMELFASLGRTVLPAHWVAVMSRGPVLQLLQCSKISTMADTVVQIQKGFFYQVCVQNQPLLLMHSIYSRHPTCLERVEDVASLLLDMEELSVCQGYQNLDMCLPWEPKMCVRAALCDLLIPRDQEHCGKCSQTPER